MATVRSHLDWIQGILGDSATIGLDGPLWSRADLLEMFCDSYRALLTESQAVRRWVILEVPGRFTATGTAEWEARYAARGSFWCFAHQTPGYACTSLWEVEFLAGRPAAIGGEGVTQEWERAFRNPVETPYRFALPRDSERIQALYYDHRRLMVLEVRELDSLWRDWRSLGGYPLTWTLGTGRARTFEVYEIITSDSQVYHLAGGPWGLPRHFSGSRTYTLGSTTLYGIARTVESPDRQYLATVGCWGAPREYHSSAGSLAVLEVVGPEVPDLLETDTPDLIPPQMERYLRYGTLAGAWESQGEGAQPALAAICRQIFDHGVQRLRTLSWLTRKDEDTQRGMQGQDYRQRPPRVRLPSNYPATRW